MDPWELCRRRYLRMAISTEVVSSLQATDPQDDQPVLSSLESQQRFLDYVLRNPISTRFPPSPKYTSRILKLVLDFLGSKFEVLEELMEIYFDLSTAKPASDGLIRDLVYKSWLLARNGDKEEFVTIRMASQLDTVGLTSWQAGYMLAEYIAANTERFKDKKCLELGSGVGLTGIVLAKLTQTAEICLTDYTTEILSNMRTNCEINDLPNLDVRQLDWEEFNEANSDPSGLVPFLPDIIMAADCVYDIGLIQKLCVVLRWYLSRSKSTQSTAIIATTLRNPKTFQFFMDELKANSLHHEDITATSTFNDIFDEPRSGIILSQITYDPEAPKCT